MMRLIIALIVVVALQALAYFALDMDYRILGVVPAYWSGMVWSDFGWPNR